MVSAQSVPVTGPAERYGDRLFAKRNEGESDRLLALARLWDPNTIKGVEELRLASGSRCLEVGAGTGTFASWLGAHCPQGTIVATDIDTSLLDQRADPRVEILRHNVVTDELPDGPFDLIHTRAVLCHLPERDEVIGKLVRRLAPGGTLFVEEPCMLAVESSPDPLYRKVISASITGARRAIGSDILGWPRSFPRPLAGHGLTGIRLRVDTPVVSGGSAAALAIKLSLRAAAPVILAEGVTAEEIDQVIDLLDEPGFADVAFMTFGALGTHP